MESGWNPVGIPTEPNRREPNRREPNRREPNRREPNRREPNRTEMDGCFVELWNNYPELRRGSMQSAKVAFASSVQTVEDCELAIKNLAEWKKSEQWVKDGGQYVPYLCNWLERGAWKVAPIRPSSYPWGASGEMGEAELDAIRRVIAASDDI